LVLESASTHAAWCGACGVVAGVSECERDRAAAAPVARDDALLAQVAKRSQLCFRATQLFRVKR
jgi:hypothetical protein